MFDKQKIPFQKVAFFAIMGLVVLIIAGCSSPGEQSLKIGNQNEVPIVTSYETPQNIDLLKQQLKAYYYSGGYDQAVAQVAMAALDYLKTCNDIPGKLAIVIDVDETALSNFALEEEMDFAFDPVKYDQFVRSNRETLIKPTLKIFNQAQKQGVATIFLTGRKESYKQATIDDLQRLGYENYTLLIMRPNDMKPVSAAVFKMLEREKIEKEGYRIILNIGDQYSDFQGGYYDKGFKYPNPFYYIQ